MKLINMRLFRGYMLMQDRSRGLEIYFIQKLRHGIGQHRGLYISHLHRVMIFGLGSCCFFVFNFLQRKIIGEK